MNEAQRQFHQLGIQPRPDYSNHDTYRLRHRGDFDELRRQAHLEGPESVTYARYMSALQQGLDETLPDPHFLGAVPMSVQDQEVVLNQAVLDNQNTWVRVHPLLTQCGPGDGLSFADHPPEVARNFVAQMAADGYRAEAMQLVAAIENSYEGNMGTRINIEELDEDLTYEVASDPHSIPGAVDPYTTWRQEQQLRAGDLSIQPAGSDAALFAGISPDGLSYDRSADWSADADA